MGKNTSRSSCCLCGKNKKTHPGLKLHAFPENAKSLSNIVWDHHSKDIPSPTCRLARLGGMSILWKYLRHLQDDVELIS
ncbi:hypothetical protein E2C01_080085 [Portunus trituberculatus]|uniref:Uncharacterized protein n=1 Tax=Portunus trituberculatus TaxID=210409 RepID=A0A5B7IUH2_PORTR|nr:hypothetical protein [Portunus trituberculatus]